MFFSQLPVTEKSTLRQKTANHPELSSRALETNHTPQIKARERGRPAATRAALIRGENRITLWAATRKRAARFRTAPKGTDFGNLIGYSG